MSNTTSYVQPPWGFEYLPDQQSAKSQWWWQIAACLTAGGYAWDIVLSLPEDLEFVFFRSFNYVTCIYIVNRLAATLCLSLYFVITVIATPACQTINRIIPASEGITLFTSCALLFLRIWVLYRQQTYVIIFMLVLLFPAPILNMVGWIPLKEIVLPNTSGCTLGEAPPKWGYLEFLFQAVYDLLVFILCMIKLLTKSDLSIRNLRYNLAGIGINVRREFIKGGFVYYIPNVIIQIVTVILITVTGTTNIQYLTTPCGTAIASAQSLRITRKLWKAAISGQRVENVSDEKNLYSTPQVDESVLQEPSVTAGSLNFEGRRSRKRGMDEDIEWTENSGGFEQRQFEIVDLRH